jgi:type I restriction enzyme R subunit
MKSNFAFLKSHFPVLANFGILAEKYCYSDSNSCIMKLGMIGETIVNLMLTYDKIKIPTDCNAVTKIKILSLQGLLTPDLSDILHALRKARNKAAHTNYENIKEGQTLLEMAYSLCEWFMQTYGDLQYKHCKFVMPTEADAKSITDNDDKAAEQKMLEETEKIAAAAKAVAADERRKRALAAASQRQKSEAETRYMIDTQLRKVGWEADTENLRYGKGIRPQKGKNLAIAEWPTLSVAGNKGRADYALFAGEKLVAVIEAKAEHKDIPSVIDYQCKEYAQNIRPEDEKYVITRWGKYKAPFVFATNGRPYLAQLETKSGIWFLDLRESANMPKALRGWISPDGMLKLLESDIEKADKALQTLPYDFLRDKDGLNLRQYQLNAIQAAENAVINGQKSVLLAMATGTGKTRTVLGMIYRFLKTGRFNRILFLVDRTALGEQAEDVFNEVKLEDLKTLNDIYDIKTLEDAVFEDETKVHIATVQGMVKRLLYNDEERQPSVTDYDLIVIDEAHRGYLLDKEMGEDELLYRDQLDYQSKYRMVIEYFDAVKIALTATPALHTTQIFGKPVFKYTYREAVIEGYLVDYDAPHKIKTQFNTEGIKYNKGETLALYDPVTHEITNSEVLQDEMNFDVEKFNKQIITPSFNRTVLEEIARDIDPEDVMQGKTLIYAVDDEHADLIVKILKEIYTNYGIDNDAIMKITGSVAGGNKRKVQEAIKRFKNERFPSIAVTVDLLTTGIDVPEITTLVFMRRVKSRILFEQMLGRATRLCPKINKTHFEIYDPVGVYDSLEEVNTMQPVSADPKTTFVQLLDGLEVLEDEAHIKNAIAQIIAKLQRVKRKLTKEEVNEFKDLAAGLTVEGFIQKIESLPAAEARNTLLMEASLLEMLDDKHRHGGYTKVISDKQDKFLIRERGFGKNEQRPEDYIEAFEDFVKNNVNEIAALNIICTRPKELTRETLKSLRMALAQNGFTTQQLNTAVSEITSEEITADIISLVRRYAIGSPLVSHQARIRRAVDKLKKAHNFSRVELNWLSRIESYLLNESVMNVKVFDEDERFKTNGGYKRLNQIFRNNLEGIITELNEYLYDDGGRTA